MSKFRFTGDYETNVGLPDGSVRLTQPGEVADLDFPAPGPLWAPTADAAAAEKKAAAEAKRQETIAAKKAAAAQAEAVAAQAEAAAVAAEAVVPAPTTEETTS